MLETPHVLVGAAIATKIVNPVLSIPLALGSHFILDKTPHWNPHTMTETEKYGKPRKNTTLLIASDSLCALFAGFYIASRSLPNYSHFFVILFCCFLSVVPDVVEAPYFYFNVRSKLLKKWINFQKSIQTNVGILPGLLTQLLVIITALWWI